MDDSTQASNSVNGLVPYPVSFTNVTRTEVTLNFPWNQHGVWIFFEGETYKITTPTSEYTFTGLTPGQVCNFTVEEPFFPPSLYLPSIVSIATLRNKPTKPVYLGSFEHKKDSVLLHWGPGTVDGGQVSYKVRRDEDVLKEKTEETGCWDLTPQQGRTYIYSVCTIDDQGNESHRTTLTLSFD